MLLRWWGAVPYTLEALALGASTGAYARGYDAVVRLLSPSYDLGQVRLSVRPRHSGVIAHAHHGAAPCAELSPQSQRPHDGSRLHWERPGGRRLRGSARARRRQRSLVAVGRRFGRCRGGRRLHDGPWLRAAGAHSLRALPLGGARYGAGRGDGRACRWGGGCARAGRFAVTYFPTIVWPSAGVAVLMGTVCYGAFLAIPAVINCGGRALWRYSLSKS